MPEALFERISRISREGDKRMKLFHRIDDAECIIRAGRGVYKQAELYRRGDRVYVKAAGGFVRVTAQFGESWGTSNPGVNVVDMPTHVAGLSVQRGREPSWTGSQGA